MTQEEVIRAAIRNQTAIRNQDLRQGFLQKITEFILILHYV